MALVNRVATFVIHIIAVVSKSCHAMVTKSCHAMATKSCHAMVTKVAIALQWEKG